MNKSRSQNRIVRTLAIGAGVLAIGLVSSASPANAGGIPLPHEIIEAHLRPVDQILRHTSVVVRAPIPAPVYVAPRPYYRPYRAYRPYYRPYYRPVYAPPVVVGGGYYYARPGFSAYVSIPPVAVTVGGGCAADRHDAYRDDAYRQGDDRRYRRDDDDQGEGN